MKAISFDLIISLIAGIFVCLVVFPMVALFTTTSVAELANQFRSSGILSAVIISFQTSLIVVLLACCLGIPVAYILAMKDFRGKEVLDTLVDLPIAVPPLVAGLALLVLLGGSSPLGGMLSRHGIELVFSKKGIIIAQLFVSSPFLIKSAREAFESINKNVTHASWVLGASKFYTFRKVMLPLAKNGIYAGMVMTWARALGEFGATSMVAGCIPFKTETMTVAIYQNAMSGELKASIAVALLLTVFSFTLLLIFKSRAKISRINIEKEKDKFPHQLSGGQKQRVALARTLVTEPEILLMDEPMSSLDPLTKERIGEELKSIQQEMGITTIYVTHNQEEAVSLGNRVSILHRGKIEQAEAPDELFSHPKTEFVAHFVGANNILNVSVVEINPRDAVVRLCNEGVERSIEIRVKKYPILEKKLKDINLCIHPEKITLTKETGHVNDKLNRIKGRIVNRTHNGHGIKIMVDIGGMMLQAVVPKYPFDFKLYENVWVCFPPDALHPLCGKRCRSPKAYRVCLKMPSIKG